MRNLNDIFNLNDSNKCSWNMDVAIESLMDGDSRYAYDHLVDLFFDEISQIDNQAKGRPYYRFSSIPTIGKSEKINIEKDPVINDVLNDSLTFSNPNNFNDPMDPIIKVWLENRKKSTSEKTEKKLFKMLLKILAKNFRVACVASSSSDKKEAIETYCNPLMWAHYANNHKGICIQYDLSDRTIFSHNDENHLLKICDVRYRNHKMLSDFITIDNALLAKSDCWEYEHESRLMFYVKDNLEWRTTSGVSNYVTLTGFPIKAVYLGCRVDQKVQSFLKKKLATKNIPLYKMAFIKDDLTKMEARLIKTNL